MKKKGFTLIELLVVIAIIAMLLAILMPALNKVKKIAQRVVCGTNLKGMGNAQTVYANDFDGQYVCQGTGTAHTWGEYTQGWMNPSLPWSTSRPITVGASLYLLVRLADVSPKSFICPSSDQHEFSGKNPINADIVELFDFGQSTGTPGFNATQMEDDGPTRCVSYSYQQPYNGTASTGSPGRYRADDTRSAAFAVMADKNPWWDPKLPRGGQGTTATWIETISFMNAYYNDVADPRGLTDRQGIMIANAQPHEREGQNVMFADGHNSFEKTPDVGVKNDNIYTRIDTGNTAPGGWRQGLFTVPCPSRTNTERPSTMEDSYLVNDSIGTIRTQTGS